MFNKCYGIIKKLLYHSHPLKFDFSTKSPLTFTSILLPKEFIKHIMKTLQIGSITARIPIIQGGMGIGVSLSGLAAAVANEGGIGVISATGLSLLYARPSDSFVEAGNRGLAEEIRKARKKSDGIIGVNIMVALTNFAELVKTSIAEKADLIFCGAGLPLDLPAFLTKNSKTKLVPIVSSARAAKLICQKWASSYQYLPDAVVLEGPEAGGHLGYKPSQLKDPCFSLEELLPQVVAEVSYFEKKYHKSIPVIAAGGIYTGEDIHRMMRLGASGVQLGTRFVTTDECDAADSFKELYVNTGQEDIEIIESPVGMPGRAIHSFFLQKVKKGMEYPKACPFHCIKTCDSKKSPYCIALALYHAYKGNFEKGFAFAGSNAFKAKRILSVRDTIGELSREYERSCEGSDCPVNR